MQAPKPTETTKEIVKDVLNYIYDTYGRFPAFVDPMYMRLVFQAMHIDVDFYEKYYPKGSYTDLHLNHFKHFHSDIKDPFAHKTKKDKKVAASGAKKKKARA